MICIDSNSILEQLEDLIQSSDSRDIRVLAVAIYDTRKEIKNIKSIVTSIKTFIQVGLTIISILLSIVAIISYLK